jgi:hypothetical protein
MDTDMTGVFFEEPPPPQPHKRDRTDKNKAIFLMLSISWDIEEQIAFREFT